MQSVSSGFVQRSVSQENLALATSPDTRRLTANSVALFGDKEKPKKGIGGYLFFGLLVAVVFSFLFGRTTEVSKSTLENNDGTTIDLLKRDTEKGPQDEGELKKIKPTPSDDPFND